MGVTVTFEQENMLNEVIPYAGSAPAYIYAFADAMVRSAVQHGVPEADALRMFCQTMIGSAKMLLRGGPDARRADWRGLLARRHHGRGDEGARIARSVRYFGGSVR